jgi:hypothetical protein
MKILSLLMTVETEDSLKFIADDLQQEINCCTNSYNLLSLNCIDITEKTIIREMKHDEIKYNSK